MCYLLYLMFRCDRRCDGKFGNFVGTKHTPCIFHYSSMCGVSAAQIAGGFFFVWETHHSPWTSHGLFWCFLCGLHLAKHADCAKEFNSTNSLPAPVVFNYWMEILCLQWLFGLWFGLLCIHCAFLYGLMAAGWVAWLQPMWANRTRTIMLRAWDCPMSSTSYTSMSAATLREDFCWWW